jgi:hypothetical protein
MTKARLDRDVTQAQLAERLGVRQSVVSMLESGEMSLPGDLGDRIKAWIDSGAGAKRKAPRGPRGNYKKRSTVQ